MPPRDRQNSMPIHLDMEGVQKRSFFKKRVRSTEVGTQNHLQKQDFRQEDTSEHINEGLKMGETKKEEKIEKIIFRENRLFGLISQEICPQKHDFPHINEIFDSPNTTQEKSSNGPPKWHKERSRPPQWVFNYLQVWSKKQPDYLSKSSKNSGKHEAEWRDPTSLIFEETHTSLISKCAP